MIKKKQIIKGEERRGTDKDTRKSKTFPVLFLSVYVA